jgi:hypothetical protein
MASKPKVKKGSIVKHDLSELYAQESAKEYLSTYGWNVSGNPMVPSVVKGVTVFRQPALINKYNPKGITLAGIDYTLAKTVAEADNTDWAYVNRILEKPVGSLWEVEAEKSREHPKPVPAQVWEIRSKIESTNTDDTSSKMKNISGIILTTQDYLIQKIDNDIASLIKDHPLALLNCPLVQDAWARWTYSLLWGNCADTRIQANNLIESCRTKNRGRPTNTIIDDCTLSRLYCDCRDYVNCLYACAIKLKDKDKVLELFPDAKRLEGVGINLDEINSRPEANVVAAEYIGHACGLSKDSVWNLATEANKKDREAED